MLDITCWIPFLKDMVELGWFICCAIVVYKKVYHLWITEEHTFVLRVQVYNKKLGRPAADNLCLGIPSGECFGLLGVNGEWTSEDSSLKLTDVLQWRTHVAPE